MSNFPISRIFRNLELNRNPFKIITITLSNVCILFVPLEFRHLNVNHIIYLLYNLTSASILQFQRSVIKYTPHAYKSYHWIMIFIWWGGGCNYRPLTEIRALIRLLYLTTTVHIIISVIFYYHYTHLFNSSTILQLCVCVYVCVWVLLFAWP